jgi:phosphoglucosamine mutase
MGRLFGTDGIRGLANRYPMDAETALRVGRAAAEVMGSRAADAAAPAVVGQDTRISGDMLAQAAAAGILAAGMGAVRVGVLPTPAVAHLVASTGAPLGIMISASHNPYEDNGIKIFDAAGMKIDDRLENEIENHLLDGSTGPPARPSEPAAMSLPLQDPLEAYRRFLVEAGRAAGMLEGLDLVLDCANGAASRLAPLVFADLGARVTVMAARPDGRNINAGCGSEHPRDLARKVVQIGAHAGLAFDGDADRVVAVDETGQVLTGDQSIAIARSALRGDDSDEQPGTGPGAARSRHRPSYQ